MSNLRNKYLTPYAQKLRKNMTKEEKHLWYDFLKDLPIPFKRQKVIDKYIVDFICPRAKLIIELDGDQHYNDLENRLKDEVRDEYFKKLGIKVLRIFNVDINKNFEGVCVEILKHLPREVTEKKYGEGYAKLLFPDIQCNW